MLGSRNMSRILLFLSTGILLVLPFPLFAQTVPAPSTEARQSSVRVVCDSRQGSGTIISADGFVLTNAHVVANIDATPIRPASECQIGIIDPLTERVRYLYRARIERFVIEHAHNQDFALLRITEAVSQERFTAPFPFRKIWEFSVENERMWTLGFPGNTNGSGSTFTVQAGFIQGFSNGFIRTTAIFRPGNSGGSAFNERGELIGMPTRIVTITEDGKAQRIRYELIDIRAVLAWLDTFGTSERDRFFTFADPERSRRSISFIEQSSLECDYLARVESVSTVFCLLPGDERLTFPNLGTYLSWYPTFDRIETVPDASLAGFRLSRNVTFRPGTLVKSSTFPSVYLVTDVFGTMRHIPTEDRAKELWGANWASLVRDIPDEFFVNYTIGPALL